MNLMVTIFLFSVELLLNTNIQDIMERTRNTVDKILLQKLQTTKEIYKLLETPTRKTRAIHDNLREVHDGKSVTNNTVYCIAGSSYCHVLLEKHKKTRNIARVNEHSAIVTH